MKIAILHATAGAGHKKAAEAIWAGLKKRGQHEAVCIDALDYTNAFFKSMYPASYVFMVTKLPFIWEFFFGLLDWPVLWPLMRCVRRIYNGLNTQALEKFLIEGQFDVICCTHFLSAEVLGHLKKHKRISAKIICCITDFDVHRIWVNDGVDLYTVASDVTRERLLSLGVPPNQIKVTGIPVDEIFSESIEKERMRQHLALDTQAFTVLLATGSFGMGPLEELIHALKGCQLLVVCGHNQDLYQHLQKLDGGLVKIYGLVKNMHELMKASDVMLTKPGGLSVAEALTVRLPMIFFSAIPGQEYGNIRVLKQYGAGEDQMQVPQIIQAISTLKNEPERLQALRNALQPLSKPHAVNDIIESMSS